MQFQVLRQRKTKVEKIENESNKKMLKAKKKQGEKPNNSKNKAKKSYLAISVLGQLTVSPISGWSDSPEFNLYYIVQFSSLVLS